MADTGIRVRPKGVDFPKIGPSLQPVFKDITQYPVLLNPHTPYITSRAALVFVAPHVLDVAGGVAEFGWGMEVLTEGEGGIEWQHGPPHEGARVMAWFHPSTPAKYNVDFSCEGQPAHSFVLQSEGHTETVEIPSPGLGPELFPLAKALVGMTFVAQDLEWRWFSVSMDAHWKLLSFEVVKLPD